MTKRQNKKWNIKCHALDKSLVEKISSELGLSKPVSAIILNRGYNTKEEAEAFIKKDHVILHDPYLFKDMDKAVERIDRAIKNNEKIVIYGDYDVDGVPL